MIQSQINTTEQVMLQIPENIDHSLKILSLVHLKKQAVIFIDSDGRSTGFKDILVQMKWVAFTYI